MFKIISKALIPSLCLLVAISLPNAAKAEGSRHFTKPLVTLSPSVHNELEVKYIYLDEAHAKAHELEVELGYLLTRDVSVELKVPFVYHDPDSISEGHDYDIYLPDAEVDSLLFSKSSGHGTSSESAFGNVVLGLKMQNRALLRDGVLMGFSLGLGLPTGDSDKGIGSDEIYTLQPTYSVGLEQGHLQFITSGKFILPLNSEEGEDDDSSFHFGISCLLKVTKEFKPLIELDGMTYLEGDASGDIVVNLSPGLRYTINHGLDFGAGFSFPISHDELFDFRFITSLMAKF